MTAIWSFLAVMTIGWTVVNGAQCLFGHGSCYCEKEHANDTDMYSTADCQFGSKKIDLTLSAPNVTVKHTITISDKMTLTEFVGGVGDQVFDQFKLIDKIELNNEDGSAESQTWSATAFNGIDLRELTVRYINFDYPSDPFINMVKLEKLTLSNANLKDRIINGGLLDTLPVGVTELILNRLYLGCVPKRALTTNVQLQRLNLKMNDITEIRYGDFPQGNRLTVVDLTWNSVTTVEPGAFSTLAKVESLYLTIAESFDLSLLEGMNQLQVLDLLLEGDDMKITASNVLAIPTEIKSLYIDSNSISSWNTSLGIYLNMTTTPMVTLNVFRFNCENNEWMAQFFCTKRITFVQDVNCTDIDMLVSDYLKKVEGKDCLPEPSTSPPTAKPTIVTTFVIDPTTGSSSQVGVTLLVMILAAVLSCLTLKSN